MFYNKHNWINGEVISADKLNNIENGIFSLKYDFTSLFIDSNTIDGDKFEDFLNLLPPIVYLNVDGQTPLFYKSGIQGGWYTWESLGNDPISITWTLEYDELGPTIFMSLPGNTNLYFTYDETSGNYLKVTQDSSPSDE